MAKTSMHARHCNVDDCVRPWFKRGMCSRHYRAWWTYGDPRYSMRVDNGGRCSVLGCERPPRSRTSPHCEVHYYRLRRNGSLDCVHVAHRINHSDGYVLVPARGHRVTTQSTRSHAYEHRKVFFDAHGEGPFNCHVCGCAVTWDDMHVDHLNEIRDDNRIENLSPACPTCNQWRGKDRQECALRSPKVRWLEYGGERLPISGWAQRLGISHSALAFRLDSGWPIDRALTMPRGRFGPRRAA